MCCIGDVSNMDMTEDMRLCNYTCNDCGGKFKGVRVDRKVKCPDCQSPNGLIVT